MVYQDIRNYGGFVELKAQYRLGGGFDILSSNKGERLFEELRIDQVATVSFLLLTVEVQVAEGSFVQMEFLYDHRCDSITKLRQGKGKSFKDLGIKRKRAMVLKKVLIRQAKKVLKRQAQLAEPLPLFAMKG
jgi:hypothetical protein